MRYTLAVTLVGLLLIGAAWAQDFDRGIDALREGDYEKARSIFEPMAKEGDMYAQDLLGGMYLEGHGVDQNPFEAARWFELAAAQGYASAQYQLGVLYLEGRGVSEDHAAAARWFLLAAIQGIDRAQFNLAFMLSKGIGVTQDEAQAASWLKKAAGQGHATAHNHLGVMYAKGTGLPQDYITAHLHFNVGCALGDAEGCRNREAIEQLLTPADISEAQRRARLCMESSYTDCD